MTQQHTNNSNSNSQSEKPALESSEAGGRSKGQPPRRFKVGDVVRYVNPQGVDLGFRTITEVQEEEIWEPWMTHRYYITPTDTPWYAVDEACLTMHLPALPPGCNSWIAEAPARHKGYKGSRFVELFLRSDAEALAAVGWTIRTAFDHLATINAEARA